MGSGSSPRESTRGEGGAPTALPAGRGRAEPPCRVLIDSHVHLFPPRVFAALWRWFDRYAWTIKYRLESEQVIAFLVERGVEKLVALHYAHVPGMARALNRYVAEVARAHPQVIPLATVLPGEPDARAILDEAFGPLGLRGVKLHCHVQRLAADDPRMDEVYDACEAAGLPAIVHAGRAPAPKEPEGYGVDPYALCRVEAVERVLRRHPRLKLVIPHLGADEFAAYERLLDEHEHLHLDTAMAIGRFFDGARPSPVDREVIRRHPDRILFGTDFPNLPYEWSTELDVVRSLALPPADEAKVLAGNALRLFN